MPIPPFRSGHVLVPTVALILAPLMPGSHAHAQVRARDLGVAPGIFAPGPANAITDVAGVRVGHATVRRGDSVNTGVTAILPHEGNPFLERVPAAMYVGNGFGKLLGVTQVRELGELESPILLTCTLCVWKVADALAGWMLRRPGMEEVRSINVVVGETNDGGLNAIRSRPVEASQVEEALAAAAGGPVAEGSVGAGTGTTAFGWKAGIGTSSRRLPPGLGGWTVGVLVQSNFGGILQVLGVPVGRALGRYAFREQTTARPGDGSIMVVVATDAPLGDRNLERLASRAMLGVGRTGSFAANGSGDYVVAFSTHPSLRRAPGAAPASPLELGNEATSALFEAVVESTEEAIYNSLFMATTVEGARGRAEPISLDRVRAVLAEYGVRRR